MEPKLTLKHIGVFKDWSEYFSYQRELQEAFDRRQKIIKDIRDEEIEERQRKQFLESY